MSNLRRPKARRAGHQRRRLAALSKVAARRHLWGAERLEDRNLMAADVALRAPDSPYWNYRNPTDVNNDSNVSALDLLSVVNAITARGLGSLITPTPNTAEGEQTGSSMSSSAGLGYVDTNNDGLLNAMDLLNVVNDLMAEGEEPIMAVYRLVPIKEGGNVNVPGDVLTTIAEGDYFEVAVMVQDLGLLTYNDGTTIYTRTATQPGFPTRSNLGVFTAYLNMNWDTDQIITQTNEANFVQISGSPTPGQTRFRLTFNGQTTGDILYLGESVDTANNMTIALTALPGIGRSAATATYPTGAPNFEVEPEATGGFRVRFLNPFGNQDAPALTGALVAGSQFGATSVDVSATTPVISGLPTDTDTLQEAFRARPVRNTAFPNSPINGTLYYILQNDITTSVAVVNDAVTSAVTPTTTTFAGSVALSSVDNFYLGRTVVFTSGALHGKTAVVTGYTGANRQFTFATGFTSAPAVGDQFQLLGGVRNTGGIVGAGFVTPPLPLNLPGTTEREVYRVRMNAVESNQTAAQTIAGDVTNLSVSQRMALLGFDGGGSGPTIAADRISVVNASITITEEVTAPSYDRTLSEGNVAGVTIDVVTDTNSLDGIAATDNSAPAQPLTITGVTQPAGGAAVGTVSFLNSNPNRGVKFVPSADFSGLARFTYTVSDGVGHSDTGTITVTVTADNDAPTVTYTAGTQTISEDPVTPLTFSGASAITIADVDAGAANVQLNLNVPSDGFGAQGTLALGSVPGSLSVTGTASAMVVTGPIVDINTALNGLKFTPRSQFNGATSLTVQVNDLGNTPGPAKLSPLTTINITVNAANDPPTIAYTGGSQNVADHVPLIFTGATKITIDDIDLLAGTVTVDLSTVSSTAVLTPEAGNGSISGSGTNHVTITGTLAQVNAALDGLTYQNDLPFGETLTVGVSDNGFTGPPGPPDIRTASLPISITVVPSFRPFAIDDSTTTLVGPILEGSTSSVVLDVLLNDLANAGETKFFDATPTLPVGRGTISIQGTAPNEKLLYTPPGGDFFGSFTFTYTMRETDNVPENPPGQIANSGPQTATVTVTITNVPDNPVGVADNYLGVNGATEDQVFSVTAANGLLANDTDADNLTGPANAGLTVDTSTVTQPPAGQGTVSVAADGSFSWTPPAGLHFNGQTSFTYKAKDAGGLLSAATTVTIDVKNVPDAPVATADSYTGVNAATEDQVFTVNAANGVLNNDTDPDNKVGDPDTGTLHAVLTQPANVGVVTLNDDGSFTWNPATNGGPNFNGTVTFKYKAHDDTAPTNLESAETTVTIEVKPQDDAPVAVNDSTSYTAFEQETLTVGASTGLLRTTSPIVTDIDSAQANLRVALVSGPSEGTFVFNSDGLGGFSYTPRTDVTPLPSVTFTYRAFDVNNAANLSNTATVTINIFPFNDPPTANTTASVTATEDQTLNMSVASLIAAAGAADEELSPLSVVITTGVPAGFGTLVQNGDGSLTYNPEPQKFNSAGFTTFSIRFFDGGKSSDPPTVVTIKLNEDNDVPVAVNDAYTAIKNFTNQTIDVLTGVNSGGVADNNGNDTTLNGPASDLVGETLFVQSLTQGATTVTRDGSGNTADLTTALGGKVRLVGGVVKYDSPAGQQDVFDSFQYTVADGRGKTATATVTVNVLNFIAKSVGGRVFVDKNSDGLFNGTDMPLQNVEIHLDGQDLLNPGAPIDIHQIKFTDSNGLYSFDGLRPGRYTITQLQPLYMGDGEDNNSTNNPLVSPAGNNAFLVEWTATDFSGNITGLNSGEKGISPTANNPGDSPLVDSSGFTGEILASGGSQGVVFGVNGNDTTDWAYTIPGVGWANLRSIRLQLVRPGMASGLLTVTDLLGNTYTKTIFQDPHNNQGGSTPPTGSLARFRVLGIGATGEAIIRLDGSAADFGFTLLAAAIQSAPEAGEGEGPTADREFSQGADQVFAEGQWA